VQDPPDVSPTHWDNTRNGLLAGEKLLQQLRQMEAAYFERNKREYEITKHVSLAEIAPLELLKLRGNDACEVSLPEWLFDRDWSGHYLRRIKSVSMTVPVVNGPYVGVNCKLTLLKSSIRKNSTGTTYAPNEPADHFIVHYGATQSIVTSAGQNDSGLFELQFRDERYLPFEGLGALSTWRIELDKQTNRFDPTDVHDIVLHLRYTAREGGGVFNGIVAGTLDTGGAAKGYRLFSVKTDFPDAWHLFSTEHEDGERTLVLPLVTQHFQPILGTRELKITKLHLFAKRFEGDDTSLQVELRKPNEEFAETFTFTQTLETSVGEYGEAMLSDVKDTLTEEILPATANAFAPWRLKIDQETFDLEDIWLVCEYEKKA